jgi:hypothetical protein
MTNKKITWKKSKRTSCEQNINARIEANKVRAQLAVLTPDREVTANELRARLAFFNGEKV